MIRQMLSNMIAGRPIAGLRTRESLGRPEIFGNIFGYEGIKRTVHQISEFTTAGAYPVSWTSRTGENPFLEMYLRDIRREKGILYCGW